ncbi:type II toxin-antitoxin system VapC family toxin [Oryzibacter oryziterrae]|uniref:type II toxin-antitoxin system VapC family toxin n=1 Tax=Oryzibacter oryziterrae TaxID=2766474 RepID=UPI001F37C1C1|nr:PIN domain nuclease [Oryzibacter oryziterrae]
MIVVDSSVWIGLLRQSKSPATDRIRHCKDPNEILVGDIILHEVLRGARDEAHAQSILRWLQTFPVVEMMDKQRAINAAANYRRLREVGVTVRKTADMIIGTYCLDEGHLLLHEDRDFEPMAVHLGLRFA